MGDGTKENPYTRKDVLRRIRRNGGTASGLDLADKYFEEGIDLHGLDLEGIDLSGARLMEANLEGANLIHAVLVHTFFTEANLEGADFMGSFPREAIFHGALLGRAFFRWADLGGARLSSAHLEGADFREAHFGGVYLDDTEIPYNVRLEEVHWGRNYILGEEERGFLDTAEATYRRLKTWHTAHGFYDIAGKFFYREMEIRRKAQRWGKKPHLKLWYWAMRVLCGYGEKPERVVISAAVIVFGLAIAYFLWGSFTSSSFWDTLYYSVASFTALGYGQWAPQPTGWAKGVGAAEAVLGVSMMALFLVTFTRKVIR